MELDLFPEFTRQFIDTAQGASIFVRTNIEKTKPPVLLLHGYPQTHVEFHKIVPYLLPYFSIILLDLRGYGASSAVPSKYGSGYSKRLMAQDCVSVMAQLGYDNFTVVGHDRGARVAYRLAFDHSRKVHKVAVIDIIPTLAMYKGFSNINAGLKSISLAFPCPTRTIP
jgi:haloacetate dehalogenase